MFRKRLAALGLLVIIAAFTVLVPAAEARIIRRANQPAPSPPPAAARPAVGPAVVTIAPSCAPAICCPRDICYRHHKGCGCYDPCKKMELILQVKDPCSCCLVEVPVCIPACCLT